MNKQKKPNQDEATAIPVPTTPRSGRTLNCCTLSQKVLALKASLPSPGSMQITKRTPKGLRLATSIT